MATLVLVDSHIGSLDRYEVGGSAVRRTHGMIYGAPVTFTTKFVEEFRTWPDPKFAVDPPPKPTNTPAGAGTATLERMAA